MTRSFSKRAQDRLEEIMKQYPEPRSAVMPALYIAQEEAGFVGPEAAAWVAEKLGMPAAHVMEVASFYTMYYKKPVGRYHFQVCRSVACAMGGAKRLTQFLKERFGLAPGEVSPDGMWSYEEVECLGSCGTAPACEINDIYFEELTVEKLEAIIKRIENEKPNLRFSTVHDSLGFGIKGYPKSQVVRPKE